MILHIEVKGPEGAQPIAPIRVAAGDSIELFLSNGSISILFESEPSPDEAVALCDAIQRLLEVGELP